MRRTTGACGSRAYDDASTIAITLGALVQLRTVGLTVGEHTFLVHTCIERGQSPRPGRMSLLKLNRRRSWCSMRSGCSSGLSPKNFGRSNSAKCSVSGIPIRTSICPKWPPWYSNSCRRNGRAWTKPSVLNICRHAETFEIDAIWQSVHTI